MVISSFEDLDVWKRCRELKNKYINLTNAFPKDERFRLTDQLIRAARSITNNIAEGYGRFHFKENIQSCRISSGSLYECIDHLYCCLDEKIIDEKLFNEYRSESVRCVQLLNGYIRCLIKQSKNNLN